LPLIQIRTHFAYRRLLAALALAFAVLGLDLAQRSALPTGASAVTSAKPGVVVPANWVETGRGTVPMPEGMAAAHASNLLAMPASHSAALTAFWFAGDRESAANVQIAASQFDRATQRWTDARLVVDRMAVGRALGFGLRRLGNPVAWTDSGGRIHLFVVATGWGGWAASRVLHLRQNSVGNALAELAFEPVGVLPLSWLWNTSYLVRNAPLALDDGGMVLPVYFELGIKYPVALRFDREGAFQGLTRVSQRNHLLQPAMVAQTPQHWLALMRDVRPNGKIGVAQTQDGGRHWADLPDLALDNPDAAVAAIAVDSGSMLMVHNPSTHSRSALDLSHSADGLQWSRVKALEQGTPPAEFSYPALAWVDGSLWVSYTAGRKRIAWQRFGPVVSGATANTATLPISGGKP
jgi:predicted neuraminidase